MSNELNIIDSFSCKNFYLCNFFKTPITYKSRIWPSAEHIFQASKSLNEAVRELIRIANTPGKVGALGRIINPRPDWDDIKNELMLEIVRLKFDQNIKIREKLINTGDAILINGNTWHDNYWGDCKCRKCQDIKGFNYLGLILMVVRKELLIYGEKSS
jgi:hypothetical protein